LKKLIAIGLMFCAWSTWADVSVVREFAPEPGRAPEMMKAAVEARAIQQKLGASVYIGTDQDGHLQYGVSFPDWAAWAKFDAAMQASPEWAAFWQKYANTNPASKLVGTVFLDQPLVAKATAVTVVYGFKVKPGRFNDFMKLAQEAAAIQTKLGASPGINVDDLGNVWYETACDSWAAWAAFDAALRKSPEWAAFEAKVDKDPIGELMRVIRIQEYKPAM
jgi:hypothetical protein